MWFADLRQGRRPTVSSALEILIRQSHLGRGLSHRMLAAMRAAVKAKGHWTGLPFDTTGDVIVPKALVPVHVDVTHDHAVYVEPNVWVQHDLSAARRPDAELERAHHADDAAAEPDAAGAVRVATQAGQFPTAVLGVLGQQSPYGAARVRPGHLELLQFVLGQTAPPHFTKHPPAPPRWRAAA